MCILFVEDNPISNSQFTSHFDIALRRQGYTIQAVLDLQSAYWLINGIDNELLILEKVVFRENSDEVFRKLWHSSFHRITGVILARVAESLAQSVTPIRSLSNFYGVTIRGTVRSVVGNQFILDDGTGQMIVDAGPRWFHQINLQPRETVVVVGKYDDYDFDAFRIIRGNGEVINIRPHGGLPPWAGGRRHWQQRQAR